jgi:hypothetical protein
VAFADRRWRELKGRRNDRVHLLQAMNEAANRAKVSKGEDSEEHRALRKWVDEHKGKESAHPKADPPKTKSGYLVLRRDYRGPDSVGNHPFLVGEADTKEEAEEIRRSAEKPYVGRSYNPNARYSVVKAG